MTKLQFRPFDKAKLVEDLTAALPHYKIKKGIGAVQVRTRTFTVTGMVGLNIQAAKGKVSTQTAIDMVAFHLIFFFPLGIYVLAKSKKQRQMEQEVVDVLRKLLN